MKDLRLARFVKILLNFVYGLLVIVCILLALWMAISSLILKYDIPGTASIPVSIGSRSEPQFEVTFHGTENDEIRYAYVGEAQGVLRLETTSGILVFISNVAMLVTCIGLAYVFHLLRTVLQAIIEGKPFMAENAIRIRRIGYLVLLLGFLQPAVEYFAASQILSRLPAVEPTLSLPSPFKAEVILASLLILILAQVWSYGMDLERDQALTI
jgi:hypothetical protein